MIKCYCGHYYDMKGDETRWCSRDTLHSVAECVGGRDMHDRLRAELGACERLAEERRMGMRSLMSECDALRTRLAESEAREEREEQLLAEIARLRDALDKHNRKESK